MSERMLLESEMLQQKLQKLTTFFDVAFVAQISASQELREVLSWCLPIQPTGSLLQKDDTAVHTAKVKEWMESAVGNSATNLGASIGITIHRECRGVDGLGRNSIFLGLDIGGRREMDKGVHRSNILRRKGYAIIMRRVDIVECVECRFHMSHGWFVVIQRQERMDRRKIRMSGAREPTNTAN
jgi:hypothetical protein